MGRKYYINLLVICEGNAKVTPGEIKGTHDSSREAASTVCDRSRSDQADDSGDGVREVFPVFTKKTIWEMKAKYSSKTFPDEPIL